MTENTDEILAGMIDASASINQLTAEEKSELKKQMLAVSAENKQRLIEMFEDEKTRTDEYNRKLATMLSHLKQSLLKLKTAERKLAEAEEADKNEEIISDMLKNIDNL